MRLEEGDIAVSDFPTAMGLLFLLCRFLVHPGCPSPQLGTATPRSALPASGQLPWSDLGGHGHSGRGSDMESKTVLSDGQGGLKPCPGSRGESFGENLSPFSDLQLGFWRVPESSGVFQRAGGSRWRKGLRVSPGSSIHGGGSYQELLMDTVLEVASDLRSSAQGLSCGQ